jgi:hypothetical protein
MLKLFHDAAVVLQDVTAVLSAYPDVPVRVAQFGRQVLIAALHRDPIELCAALDQAAELYVDLGAETEASKDAWTKLDADLKRLLTDME